jgi:hypothetical protein
MNQDHQTLPPCIKTIGYVPSESDMTLQGGVYSPMPCHLSLLLQETIQKQEKYICQLMDQVASLETLLDGVTYRVQDLEERNKALTRHEPVPPKTYPEGYKAIVQGPRNIVTSK